MDKKHRTWICSVLFMDIVGYTKFDVEEQMLVRRHYYDLVDSVLNQYCPDDFITLDAGDGMAVCYTGDPEDVLIIAVNLRDAFVDLASGDGPRYKVRLGINLGPVKIVELQGERRVIGDAVNVANRVMSFAGDNQLLVSRTYFDVVSTVSKEYENLFRFLGIHEDKHVRKHEVYEVSSNTDSVSDDAPAAPMETVVSAVGVDGDSPVFSESVLSQVQSELATHVGPVAKVMVRRATRHCSDLDALCRTLASDIADEAQQKRFLAACKAIA